MLLVQDVCWAGARDLKTAVVKVHKEASGSQFIYAYAVINNGDRPIIGLTVGHDYYRGQSELTGPHPSLIVSLHGWSSRVVILEESDRHEVRWDIETPNAAILPGQTATGFRIMAAQDRPQFTTSHWTVIMDGPPGNASHRLELAHDPI